MPEITVPQRVLVHPQGGAPYWSVRHKRVFVGAGQGMGEIKMVPVRYYAGDLNAILQSWSNFIGGQPTEIQHNLLIPVIALQEIVYKEHDGLLGIIGNRLVGIISYTRQDHNISPSIVSPSPLDIVQGRVQSIMHLLNEGFRDYLEAHSLTVEQQHDNTVGTI